MKNCAETTNSHAGRRGSSVSDEALQDVTRGAEEKEEKIQRKKVLVTVVCSVTRYTLQRERMREERMRIRKEVELVSRRRTVVTNVWRICSRASARTGSERRIRQERRL